VNGAKIGTSTVDAAGGVKVHVPGPITRQLTEAYCRFVDFDFVGQYLKRLS
jgi:hypothetical protein